MMIKGIDVSNFQSETYDLTDVDFVIVKATQSTNYTNPRHAAQVTRARTNARVVGHYHFLVAGNIQAQAEYFVQHAAPKAGDILACDWETNPATKTFPSNAEKDRFIKAVKVLCPNNKVLLYTGQQFWLTKDTTSYVGDGLWIAQYNGKPGKPDITAKWLIHQYTSTPLDTNVAAFASRAEMAAWAAGEDTDVALTDDDVQKVANAVVAKLIAGDGVLENSDLDRIWGDDVIPAARPPYNNADYYKPDGKTLDNTTWTAAYTQQTQVEGIRETLTRVKALQTALAALDPAALEAALLAKLQGLQVEVTVTKPQEA
ncbi:glycoside hydrolase family 25 protein [Streptomyces sp. NPDC005648]|uniref:glycoside hydrolase family 25 protein n=1 Tax=Streptomyces sp. NPDC005648 TaxID=3157044 RepID=UPI0033A94CE3